MLLFPLCIFLVQHFFSILVLSKHVGKKENILLIIGIHCRLSASFRLANSSIIHRRVLLVSGDLRNCFIAQKYFGIFYQKVSINLGLRPSKRANCLSPLAAQRSQEAGGRYPPSPSLYRPPSFPPHCHLHHHHLSVPLCKAPYWVQRL